MFSTAVLPLQYIGLIRNPTSTELKRGMSQGVRATWAKLSAITANSAIELELDKVVADLAWRKHEARCDSATFEFLV